MSERSTSIGALLLVLVSGACEAQVSPPRREEPPNTAVPTPAARPSPPRRHLVFASAASAVAELVETTNPTVVAFGEVHEKKGSRAVQSAIWRFGHEIVEGLATRGSHLLVETWITKGSCGKSEKRAVKKVEATTQRPAQTENEIVSLIRRAKAKGIAPHILELSCADYEALLDGKRRLDPVKLLETVTRLMQSSAQRILPRLGRGSRLLIYGGALHNDLFPRRELAPFSYGQALQRAANGRYLEIDLYVPELVEGDAEMKKEAWYPLLATLRGEQVVLFRRGEGSYVLLMRRGRVKPRPR